MTKVQVAVAGLGAIGGGVARSVARAGYDVRGYDPDPAKAKQLVADGLGHVDKPEELLATCDVAILAPFNVGQVESLLPDSTLTKMRPAVPIVVLATMPPQAARDLAARTGSRGHQLLDCPVSGGGLAAAEGRLTLMVGGPSATVAAVRPILEAFAGALFHVGEAPGAGAAVKLVNQVLYFGQVALLAEAVTFAERMGVPLPQIADVVSRSSGDSWVLRNRLPVVIDRSYRDQGSIEIAAKDLTSILATAAVLGVSMPMTGLARQLFEIVRAAWGGACDDIEIVALFEALSGLGGRLPPAFDQQPAAGTRSPWSAA